MVAGSVRRPKWSNLPAEESIRAIKRLQHTYGHYLEFGLWNDLADLFTTNAVGQFPEGSIRGRVNLRKRFMEQAGRTAPGLANGQLHSHLILQPIVRQLTSLPIPIPQRLRRAA